MTVRGESRGWRAALAIEDFRALWIAEIVASAGEQFARAAMAVLVLARTGSGPLAGLTYALPFLPAVAVRSSRESPTDTRAAPPGGR
ncbi:hypothetical protein [Amycolatopsis sp. cmx-11-12]|uniref:hypothetical protein n=1 Tax=Amycolatopsis sp. cmx-11-12 TaxID=2785795 RepID=UPI003917F6F7